jgi:hypothetical protein
MHIDGRKKLAAAQLELVRALTGRAHAPAAFDCVRIQATARTLMLKRARAVSHVWPQLARSLGATFDEQFALYAQSHPIAREVGAHEDGALADGRSFARALSRAGALADEALLETLRFDLRYRIRSETVTARRGFSIGAVVLKQSLRFVVAVRLPLLGERWLNIPLKIL